MLGVSKSDPFECEWDDVKPGIFQFSAKEPTEALSFLVTFESLRGPQALKAPLGRKFRLSAEVQAGEAADGSEWAGEVREGQGPRGTMRTPVGPPSGLHLHQPRPCRRLVRRDLGKTPEPPCLPGTLPGPLPVTHRRESPGPGTHGCTQGEVRVVGAAQPLPGRRPDAPPPGHYSPSSRTLLAASVTHSLVVPSQVWKGTGRGVRHAWI